MKLEQYYEIIDYNLTGTNKYLWKCFGKNAYFFDYYVPGSEFEFSVVADLKTGQVYYAGVSDSVKNNHYLWVDPAYKDAHREEAESRNCNYRQVYDDVEYTVLDIEADWIEKATAIYCGLDYDERVAVELDLPNDLLFEAMFRAHELDITLNEYIARAIQAVIDKQS